MENTQNSQKFNSHACFEDLSNQVEEIRNEALNPAKFHLFDFNIEFSTLDKLKVSESQSNELKSQTFRMQKMYEVEAKLIKYFTDQVNFQHIDRAIEYSIQGNERRYALYDLWRINPCTSNALDYLRLLYDDHKNTIVSRLVTDLKLTIKYAKGVPLISELFDKSNIDLAVACSLLELIKTGSSGLSAQGAHDLDHYLYSIFVQRLFSLKPELFEFKLKTTDGDDFIFQMDLLALVQGSGLAESITNSRPPFTYMVTHSDEKFSVNYLKNRIRPTLYEQISKFKILKPILSRLNVYSDRHQVTYPELETDIIRFIFISYLRSADNYQLQINSHQNFINSQRNNLNELPEYIKDELYKIFPKEEVEKAIQQVYNIINLVDKHGLDFILGHTYSGPQSIYNVSFES